MCQEKNDDSYHLLVVCFQSEDQQSIIYSHWTNCLNNCKMKWQDFIVNENASVTQSSWIHQQEWMATKSSNSHGLSQWKCHSRRGQQTLFMLPGYDRSGIFS